MRKENKKAKKNFSFKMFSKKALAMVVSVALLGSSATLLTACGSDGENRTTAYNGISTVYQM